MSNAMKKGTNDKSQRLVIDAAQVAHVKAGRLSLAEFRRAGRNKGDLGAAQAEENAALLAARTQ